MMYQNRFILKASEPQQFSTINMSSSRSHFLQINDGSEITVKATLRAGENAVEIGSVTGPGLFNIDISPQQFELISNADTVVILSGN